MSEDHKPTREDEAKRIRDAGGFVINNRVMGELAVSRAFGDVDFKKGLQVRITFYFYFLFLSFVRMRKLPGHSFAHLMQVLSHTIGFDCVGCKFFKPQSIIEEEGGSLPPSASAHGSEGEEGNSNWDQPLIVAEPDVKVSNSLSSPLAIF